MKCSQRRDCFLPFGQGRRIRFPRFASVRFWPTLAHIPTYSFNTLSLPLGTIIPRRFQSLTRTHNNYNNNNNNNNNNNTRFGRNRDEILDLGYTKWDTDGKRN